jgi:hypothetical protein
LFGLSNLDRLESLSFDDLFGEVRECFNSSKDVFDLSRLLRICYYQILQDEDRFEDQVKSYVLSNALSLKKRDVCSDRLFYDSLNAYEELGEVLKGFDVKYFSLNQPISIDDLEGLFLCSDWSDGLKDLDFSYAEITDEGFRRFCESKPEWSDLECLNISRNGLYDRSLALLEECISEKVFPKLVYVYAEDNFFGDDSMYKMHTSLSLQQLEVLDIVGSYELTRENLIHYTSMGSKLFQSGAYKEFDYSEGGQGF